MQTLDQLSAAATEGEWIVERWAPVAGWEGIYEVSDHGRIRSLSRDFGDSSGKRRPVQEQIIKLRIGRQGYPLTTLSAFGRGRQTFTVHRLVVGAFIPNPENLAMVNHINSDRTCNLYTNLEWCSHSDNVEHARAKGRLTGRPSGFRSDKRKFSDQQIRDIRCLYVAGMSARKIAERFNVSSTPIEQIVRGRSYRDVQ